MYHVFLYSIKGVHGLTTIIENFILIILIILYIQFFYDTDSRILTFTKKAHFELNRNIIFEKNLKNRINKLSSLIDKVSIDIFRKELETKGLKISNEKILDIF